jgi:Coenzyme PQQ synthesis protein D (PqqD)
VISADSRPRTTLDVRVRSSRDRTYVARRNEVFELTDVAKLIWDLSDGAVTVNDIARRVAAEYEVEQAEALQDALQFVDDLVERGFLELSD